MGGQSQTGYLYHPHNAPRKRWKMAKKECNSWMRNRDTALTIMNTQEWGVPGLGVYKNWPVISQEWVEESLKPLPLTPELFATGRCREKEGHCLRLCTH